MAGITLSERAWLELREIKKRSLGLREGDAELDRMPESKDVVVAKPITTTPNADGSVNSTIRYPSIISGIPTLTDANGSGHTCYLIEVNEMAGA